MPLQQTTPLEPKRLPEDLKDIHPWPSEVWNCYNIVFDPNVSWEKESVLINSSQDTGYGAPITEREHPFDA